MKLLASDVDVIRRVVLSLEVLARNGPDQKLTRGAFKEFCAKVADDLKVPLFRWQQAALDAHLEPTKESEREDQKLPF